MAITKNKPKLDVKIITMISNIIVISCAVIVTILSYVITYRYPVSDLTGIIQSYYDNRSIHIAESMLNLLMGVFVIPSMIGIVIFLYSKIADKKRKWLISPLITSILGAGLVVALYILKIVIIYKFVPRYIADPGNTELTNQFTNLIRIIEQLSAVVFVLLYSLGVGVIGIISISSSETKGTFPWLAILTGVLALGKIGYFLNTGFGSALALAASMGVIAYFFWLGGLVPTLNLARKEDKMNYYVES
ncbi:MAG: hypothetical protein FK730_04595 [Asgard group archaeon]|nr:hypothetical protein [Asgard group archaeon]